MTDTPPSQPETPTPSLSVLFERVAVLDEHIVAHTSEVAMLRYEVVHEADRRRQLAFWLALSAAVFAVALVAAGYVIWGNRRLVHGVSQTNRSILECTTPGTPGHPHPCFDRFRRSTSSTSTTVSTTVP